MLILSVLAEKDNIDERALLDDALVRVGKGDRDAFAIVYERSRGAVYSTALSYLKNAHDAEDVTHDTFIRVWENSPRYVSVGSPMAWILTIARNLSLMALRRGSRQEELSENEWYAIPDNAPRVTAEDRIMLETALGELNDDERRVIMLHVTSGLKHREIAELLEMPLSTVLSKYNRAIGKLRRILKGAMSRD